MTTASAANIAARVENNGVFDWFSQSIEYIRARDFKT